MTNLVFTLNSLNVMLQCAQNVAWFSSNGPEPELGSGVARIKNDGSLHFVHRDDAPNERRLIFPHQAGNPSLQDLPDEAFKAALQRAHRASLSAKSLPLRLPTDWSEYHKGNLITFFACGKNFGSYRWVAQIKPFQTDDICFWRLTAADSSVLLEDFFPEERAFSSAIANWSQSLAAARTLFDAAPRLAQYVPLDGAIDLKAVTFEAVVRHSTYSLWVEQLNPEQKVFFEHLVDHSVKLRGPAGSGKTLALAMKALRETYAQRACNPSPRVLFVTHSWAMAEQVDEMLRALDETGDINEITVFPLIEIAKSVLPENTFARGLTMLGSDSYSGKRKQLDRIDDVLWRMRQGDWLAYESTVTPGFRDRVRSTRGSPAWNSLLWDLMHEFSSVLSASNILPGITAEKRYQAIRRAEWMMPLSADAEQRFVLRVYTEYVSALRSDRLLSVDQVIKDLLSYLETFAWDYRRVHDGYDMIFVDEFHLFGEPERQVLSYLTRDPAKFPRLFLALDPRQSPSEIYADFPLEGVASAESGEAERGLGSVDAVDLTHVHRFSPEILSLVKFIQNSYPTLGLGADWLLDIDALSSLASSGYRPKLFLYKNTQSETAGVVSSVAGHFSRHGARRIAVVLVDDARLSEFQSALLAEGVPTVAIMGRDDVDTLRYQKRSIVLTAAQYAAGLQFDDVVVSGLPELAAATHLPAHQRRRVLSMLYLAVTRASASVELHVYVPPGELSELLQQAASSGVVEAS